MDETKKEKQLIQIVQSEDVDTAGISIKPSDVRRGDGAEDGG